MQARSIRDAWVRLRLTQRMKVPEKKLTHTAGDGNSFLFESWYIAREDINIYNSMATKSFSATWNGSTWAVGGNANYRLGPAIDRWVYPAFTVYFEQGRVIDAVANKAGADEIGPKPAAR